MNLCISKFSGLSRFTYSCVNYNKLVRHFLPREFPGPCTYSTKPGYVDGNTVLTKALKDQGIDTVFGVVGIPVIEAAEIFQKHGVRFVGMRNEQAAAYAAQAYGYLTRTPGVCLTVSGPGVLHALGGLANAQANSWPLILLGGSSNRNEAELGAFQEAHQVETCRPYCKFSARPHSALQIPYFVQKAVKMASYGRPGASYLDLPDDLLSSETRESEVRYVQKLPPPPQTLAPQGSIDEAIELLRNAKRPLVIAGKGCAYAGAEESLRSLIEASGIPFLTTPMGKGLLPDMHPLSVARARTFSLQKADVALVLGTKINWMLHFGQPPRFSPDVKIIQVDIEPEEFHQCIPTSVSLCGDVNKVIQQLTGGIREAGWTLNGQDWLEQISAKTEKNAKLVEALTRDESAPLNYYAALSSIQHLMPPNSFIINEGANTMDIGRNVLVHDNPRMRLDAGTYGSMGVGLGFAIAAALQAQKLGKGQRVFCIQGDSAFGFSSMEIETMVRYKLPVVSIIFNNNGIYAGYTAQAWDHLSANAVEIPLRARPTALTPEFRYEKMADMYGGKGFYCTTLPELSQALQEALKEEGKPSIINVSINPSPERKTQEFGWLKTPPPAE